MVYIHMGSKKRKFGRLNYKLKGPRNIINIYNYKYTREGHFLAGVGPLPAPPISATIYTCFEL